jgi:hypothetical protein
MPAPRIERDHRALQARVPTTQTRQARASEAEPAGYDPATSRVTGGRAAHCATAPKRSGARERHGERMTTSPGSRVSCETATRPPATARVAAVLRVLRTASHTSHRLSKSRGENADRPTRLARRWGDLVVPVGAWVDLCRRSWVLHSRLRTAPRLRVPRIVTSARGRDGLPAIPPYEPGLDTSLRLRPPR